ncbi:MAG: pilus assembly protein [Chloroflexi bacterium]|nr:pilus assembly protein [Chloroflexota bacterium]MBV9899185.1 pilus assembly protein [Chloroflexota bacterium]
MMRPRRRHQREGGQALVEFALTLSVFSIFVMLVIQLGLLFVAYYSETRMARETARWLAVNSKTTTDDLVATHMQNTMLPGLAGAAPSNQVTGTTSVDASVDVGSLHAQYTPCVTNGSVCTDSDRAPGATLYVQLQYNVAGSHVLFLPTNFRIGSLEVNVPTSLPAYRVYVLVE